jgi:hypothetical protein
MHRRPIHSAGIIGGALALMLVIAAGRATAQGQSAAPQDAPAAQDTASDQPTLQDKVVQGAKEAVKGRSIILGVGWVDDTFYYHRNENASDGSLAAVSYQDSGRATYFLQFDSAEKFLWNPPGDARTGQAGVAYNYIVHYGTFNTGNLESARSGDPSSGISGDYLFAAPLIYASFRNLMGKDFSVRTGLGLGVALMRASGTVVFHPNSGVETDSMSTQGYQFGLAIPVLIEARVSHWVFQWLLLHTEGSIPKGDYQFDHESLNLGYAFDF